MSDTLTLTSRDKTLCATYGLIALAALIATQITLVAHFVDGGTVSSALTDTVVNPAAVFVTIDLLAVATAGVVFMLAEGRRLGMRRLWVYVVLTFAVAISVAFPVFLLVRQRHLARTRA